jgi:hypothetical protein
MGYLLQNGKLRSNGYRHSLSHLNHSIEFPINKTPTKGGFYLVLPIPPTNKYFIHSPTGRPSIEFSINNCPSPVLEEPRRGLPDRGRPPGVSHGNVLAAVLLALVSFLRLSTEAEAAVIAVDGAVLAVMDTAGTSGDVAQYIVGNTGPFDRTFSEMFIDVGDVSSDTPSYTQLLIRNGSTVSAAQTAASLGLVSPSTTVTVTGTGSKLLLAGGSKEFVYYGNTAGGVSSNRLLEVLDGGRVEVQNLVAQATGRLFINGAGSIGEIQGQLRVEGSGTIFTTEIRNGGTLRLPDDTAISKSTGNVWNLTLGSGGTLEATGALNVARIDGFTFEPGGTLQVDGSLTNLSTISSGQRVDLTGGGSFGSTTVLDGGLVEVASFDFSSGNLTFTSGTLNVTGVLTNLNSLRAGEAVVLDGGSWAPSGSINAGSLTIQNGGTAIVPDGFDGSNLTFTNGSLTVTGDVSNLPTLTAGRAVTLTGGGSLQTATTLDGGSLSGGDFDLNGNLTFTSGTLTVSGTLQNLTSLPAGTAVTMSGPAADLLLSDTLTVTGGTITIDNGASVTVLENVSLGAGSISFSAAGGAISLGGGVLNVASMDTAMALNANAGITGYGTIYGSVNLGASDDAGSIAGDAANGGLVIFGNVSGSGSLADTTIYGNVTVGNSPGSMTFTNVDLGNSNIFMEIDGTAPGQYDTLSINSGSNLTSASLTVAFGSGFTPSLSDSWQLIGGDGDPYSFKTISPPDGWSLTSSGMLVAVPEPTATALGVSGLVGAAVWFRKRRRRALSGLIH